MPLPTVLDARPRSAYLRAPPLLFGRRPPQSNYPPHTVPDPDYGPRLERQARQGGISRMAPLQLAPRSEEHTSELQSLMRISYAVFCLKKKTQKHTTRYNSKNRDNNNNKTQPHNTHTTI